MKFLALWLISLVAVTLGQLFPPAFPVEDGVVVLDDANFNAALEKYDPILVEFYAPW
jgi:hypothetical protein